MYAEKLWPNVSQGVQIVQFTFFHNFGYRKVMHTGVKFVG